MTDEEWTEWFEHDGTEDCPSGVNVGDYGEIFHKIYGYQTGQVTRGSQWSEVIRYRIRRPRALQQLREMIRDLPVEVEA